MCLIVDADVASKFFSAIDPDALPAWKWVSAGDQNGWLVYSEELERQLFRVGAASRQLRSLRQAGRAFFVNAKVGEITRRLRADGICRSNDEHIIALAVVSGARVLYSNDIALHQDFKNPNLIKKPRGKIYQKAKDCKLLKHSASCPYSMSR